MPKIAVIHPDYSYMGGGEAVNFNTIEAIQNYFDDLEIFVFCKEKPAVERFNEYFGTTVDSRTITFIEFGCRFQKPRLLSQALQHKKISNLVDSHNIELTISTQNEIELFSPSVQYIHSPSPPILLDISGVFDRMYSRFCQIMSGFQGDFTDDILVANSNHTAEKVDNIYNIHPEIIYPPVDTRNIVRKPWSERENGFVTIGRISPIKNIMEIIEIVKKLRRNGRDIHLHIIGPPGNERYYRQVVEVANKLDYVYLEGELTHTDSQLERFVSKHKYAISYCEESFGISVAEVAASGLIPFVYTQGGQTEVVPRTDIQFSNGKEAVEKIEAVMDSNETEQGLRDDLRGIDEQFNRKRFQGEVIDAIESQLDESS